MSYSYDLFVDNRSATYPSWPLLFIELTNNPTMEAYDSLDGANVIDIVREDSPNFGRHIYLWQIELDPEPTIADPVRIYIDPLNRQAFVDPRSSHAQAGQVLQIFHPATRFFYLLPGIVNWISIRNGPEQTTYEYGVRWRKAYSG